MNIEYSEIALIQLEKAIDLHLNAKKFGDHICAITLAGAAEEILGKSLPEDMRATEILKDSVSQMKPHIPKSIIDGYKFNQTKNALKHPIDFSKLGLDAFEVNPKKEAEMMIRRAALNYINLVRIVPETFKAFLDFHETGTQNISETSTHL